MNGQGNDTSPAGEISPASAVPARRSGTSSGAHRRSSRERRRQKKRKREKRRTLLAVGFVATELLGFGMANFAPMNSWAELAGFLLLQPVQIVINELDAHIGFTRGLRDNDAVLLVTLLALPLNLIVWYGLWRVWRSVRRAQRRRRQRPGGTHGPALPARAPGVASSADILPPTAAPIRRNGESGVSLRK